MASSEAIQRLVQEDFVQVCTTKNHEGRPKTIFRFVSGDTVCSKCNYNEKDTIRVVKHKERNSVCLRKISKFVDCSQIRVVTMFDLNAIHLDQISDLIDCTQIQNYGSAGGKEYLLALRPWRDCVRSTEGCTKHVRGINSKFCSITCKIEHVLEHEGDLSSIARLWSSEDDSRETSEHVGDLSIHPCGDPERIFPLKRSRRRRRFFGSNEDIYASY